MSTSTAPEKDCCRDLTLCVPCYNEEGGIIPSLQTIVDSAAEVDCSYDIIVVDDASTDRSVQLVEGYMERHPEIPITLIVNETNQGLAHNFAEAAFWGQGKYYRIVCGDDVESKETLVSVFRRLGDADIILTYHSDTSARTLSRRFISYVFTGIVNLLSGHKIKYYNGSPTHSRYNVMRFHPNSRGFGFQADLITRLLDMGATYIEIPVVPKERTAGKSQALSFRNLVSVAHSLLEIFVRRVGRGLYPKLVHRLHYGQKISRTPGMLESVQGQNQPNFAPVSGEQGRSG